MDGTDFRVTTIKTIDGLALEARWEEAGNSAVAVAVLCHPHPLEGGAMNAPLLDEIARSLTPASIHVLRFNFRGVGFSEGTWGNGVGQTDDAAAAVRAAGIAFPDLRLGIAGWSFGATTSLHWQIETGSTLPWVGVAPGIGSCHGSEVPEVSRLESADRLIIIGDRDQFATVDSIQAFAIEANARLEVLPNSDHFFYFREETVGSLVAEHLEVS